MFIRYVLENGWRNYIETKTLVLGASLNPKELLSLVTTNWTNTAIGRNANFNLRINLGNRFNFGNFDFSNLNANDCCVEQPLADIYFGYNIEAALAASALIQQAGDRALNQWFHSQHTVLKKEIEKQLWQSFSNYDDARNTYFKYHENIAVSHNHKPIKSKYNARRLDGENKRSISLKNLKLLRLRENEIILSNSVNGVPVVPKEQINVDYVINNGTINLHAKKSITMSPGFHAKPGTLFHATTGNVNSSYGNFTYNGTSLDQIQNLSELQSMWENELRGQIYASQTERRLVLS